jgi:hypothetical protein
VEKIKALQEIQAKPRLLNVSLQVQVDLAQSQLRAGKLKSIKVGELLTFADLLLRASLVRHQQKSQHNVPVTRQDSAPQQDLHQIPNEAVCPKKPKKPKKPRKPRDRET